MSDNQRFASKVSFITGAASGIGRATAFAFASEGARVVILDRTEDALSETELVTINEFASQIEPEGERYAPAQLAMVGREAPAAA